GGDGVAAAGAAAGRPEDVQGDHGLDRDRLAGAGGEGGAAGRQEVAGADRGRAEGAGGLRPGELGGGRELVRDGGGGGRAGAGVGDGDGEGRRGAGVDRVREPGGDRLGDGQVREQRYARRRLGGDLVAERAEVLGQREDHRRAVGQRRGVAGLDGPGLGEGE